MDTKALERFCPWARVELIEAVRNRCVLYALDDAGRAAVPADAESMAGRVFSERERAQRAHLIADIEHMGYDAFCQRAAYRWFNRLAAIRYMELHGFLPSRVRVLSAEDGSFDPAALRAVGELDLPALDAGRALDLAAAGDDEGLFRMVLLAQCEQLAGFLPEVFGGLDEGEALLAPDGLLRRDEHGVVRALVEDVPEEAWADVEVLGWMYQFYNSELKADFFKSKRKAAAADIAPATQLFTPDWIVRYMVQNSLGRLWMLNNPGSALRDRMEFYIEPDAETEDFLRIDGPEDITFCDPACGSGHILVYAFELLFAMYEERGYLAREIPALILEKNLHGYEIDERAAQIAVLALSLRARERDRRFFSRGVSADVRVLGNIELDPDRLPDTYVKPELADAIRHLGEVGSLLDPSPADLAALDAALADAVASDLLGSALKAQLEEARGQLEALSRRFDVVVANPPYMGSSSFNPFVAKWIKKHYPDSCRDLCTAFIERGYRLAEDRGYAAMVTMQSWMFLGSFEKMRERMIESEGIVSMAHIGPRAFDAIGGEVVNVTAAVLHNGPFAGEGTYIRLVDVAGSEPKREALLEAVRNPDCGWFHRADASTFHDIPGSPIAYWASEAAISAFSTFQDFGSTASPSAGITTGNNEAFIRYWWEVSQDRVAKTARSIEDYSDNTPWGRCNKGGQLRKWFGNTENIMAFSPSARQHMCAQKGYRPVNLARQCSDSITWSDITSGTNSFRANGHGFLFDHVAISAFPSVDKIPYYLALLNSSITPYYLSFLAPTLHCNAGDISKLPSPYDPDAEQVGPLSSDCVALSRTDWDMQEFSDDFKRNPLV